MPFETSSSWQELSILEFLVQRISFCSSRRSIWEEQAPLRDLVYEMATTADILLCSGPNYMTLMIISRLPHHCFWFQPTLFWLQHCSLRTWRPSWCSLCPSTSPWRTRSSMCIVFIGQMILFLLISSHTFPLNGKMYVSAELERFNEKGWTHFPGVENKPSLIRRHSHLVRATIDPVHCSCHHIGLRIESTRVDIDKSFQRRTVFQCLYMFCPHILYPRFPSETHLWLPSFLLECVLVRVLPSLLQMSGITETSIWDLVLVPTVYIVRQVSLVPITYIGSYFYFVLIFTFVWRWLCNTSLVPSSYPSTPSQTWSGDDLAINLTLRAPLVDGSVGEAFGV